MANNSVGVNNSPNIVNVEIPAPDPTTPIVEQDKTEISNELITDSSSGLLVSSVTGSVAVENLENGPEDFLLDDEENFEEPFAEEVYEELEDESQFQTQLAPPNTIVDRDLEKYPFLGTYPDNRGILLVNCRLIDNKPVKEELIVPFMNMKEACLREIKTSILITSGYRPLYEDIFYNKKQIAQSQKSLRIENVINKNTYKEPWKSNTTIIKTGKLVALPSTMFKPETAAAGASNHGDGLALDLNTGTRRNNLPNFGPLREELYTWLINNAYKYGFIRTVSNEEWHWEYRPELASIGPYSQLSKTEKNRFYKDLDII